ncbi:hypothetical protein EAF04_001433 [Stromatinia cepivora]|nr:hypothetical protein EAF04_001433 [Stromatinia cepivora]
MSASQNSMKTTLVLALDASYRGRPSLPEDAQPWTVVMNSLNNGYAYNFTVTRSETISYSHGEHIDLRRAFDCMSLGSHTNSIEIDGRVTFIANSLCVALRRFMLGNSHRLRGTTLPVHIAIKFGDGPFVSFDTSFNVEVGLSDLLLRPGPPPTALHRFIDMATSSLKVEIPSPKSTPRPEPVDEELLDMQLDIYRRPLSSPATPVDRAYYTACSESPLFDALPVAGPACDGEYDDAIVQMLLYGGPTRHAVSTALVIADPKSECIVTSLREKGVVVSAPRCHNTHGSCDLDEKRFEYSSSGKYEFDEEQYDVVYIKMPSSEDSVVDTYHKCELATSLRDSGKVNGSIIISVASMPTVVGIYDILDIPGNSSTDTVATLRLCNSPKGPLDGNDPLKCLMIGSLEISNGHDEVSLPNHPVFSNFLCQNQNEPNVFTCWPERWHDVLFGRSYLQAHIQIPSFQHIRSAKNPLECYAALRVGAPSPLPASLEETFNPSKVYHIRILSSSFFSRNPRFVEMVSARYDELKEFCDETSLDAPKEITSLFSGPAATVLLNNLTDFRYSLIGFNGYEGRMYHHRVLSFESMAVLCSISFFCIIRMYLKARKEFLDDIIDVWDLQDLLWRLTAFGTWEEKRWYMVLKFNKLLDGTADDSEC